MTTTTTSQSTDPSVDTARPLVVVSGDSHVGPLLGDMRPYCPKPYLEDFDAYAAQQQAMQEMMANAGGFRAILGDAPEAQALAGQFEVNAVPGHHDMEARLRDMDEDGVAAEVIFHGSQNNQPVPFVDLALSFDHTENLELKGVGSHIYNQWLADACSVAPERLIGCAQLPQWDIDASVRELEWAAEAGLKAVNFAAPRPGIVGYDDPAWEPFWSAVEATQMPLATHTGAIDGDVGFGRLPHAVCIAEMEGGGWPGRRAMHRLIFGGVFERHPGVKWIVTEQNGDWWANSVREYDSSWLTHRWQLADQVPRKPSEYMATNVFIGASFMAPFEAQMAVDGGYTNNIIWGRDYPHVEGTWQYREADDPENPTHLSMRHCFAGIPSQHVKAMVQDTGVRVYNLDEPKLRAVADRIGAPTLEDLSVPIDRIPEPGRGGVLSFRQVGPWG